MRTLMTMILAAGLTWASAEAYGEFAQQSADVSAKASVTNVNKAIYLYAMDRPLDQAIATALAETPVDPSVSLVVDDGMVRYSSADACYEARVGYWEIPQPCYSMK